MSMKEPRLRSGFESHCQQYVGIWGPAERSCAERSAIAREAVAWSLTSMAVRCAGRCGFRCPESVAGGHPLVVECACSLSQHWNEPVAGLPVRLDPVAVGAQGDHLEGMITASVGQLLDVVD